MRVKTLFVEMKAGGEALHAYGMFEAGTGKMGLYSSQPSVDNSRFMRSLATYC
jgi:hypothetical protein